MTSPRTPNPSSSRTPSLSRRLDDVATMLRDAGLAVDVLDDGDELKVPLSGNKGESRYAYLKMPRLSDAVSLLTFSTSYPFGAAKDGLDDLRLGAHECTQWVPLGAFQVDDDGSLHFRYSLVVGAALPQAETLQGLWGLIDFQQLHFGDYLAQLCSGDIGIDGFADLVAAGEDD